MQVVQVCQVLLSVSVAITTVSFTAGKLRLTSLNVFVLLILAYNVL